MKSGLCTHWICVSILNTCILDLSILFCKGEVLATSPLFVSPERSSERDYVITDSVRSMYVYVVCVCMCMYVVIFCKIDHCIHIH